MNPILRTVTMTLAIAFVRLTTTDAADVQIDDLIVTAIDSVDVPAGQTGVIARVNVREGQSVTIGETIASTDDRQARVKESMTQMQVRIAQHTFSDSLAIDQAESELATVQQSAKEQMVLQQVADRKAANNVRVLASEKAAAVAKNELDRALRSRQEFIDSVSKSEIDGLRLAYEKMRLETRQAEVERAIDELGAQAAAEAAEGHRLRTEQSQIALAQTLANKDIERFTLELGQLQNEFARLDAARHHVQSPLEGIIVEVHRKRGDWVNEGEPIARVLRLNRLRAEGFVKLAMLPWLRENPAVTLSIRTGPDEHLQRAGEIVFISPEVDPVNDEVRFWVEFDNSSLDVLPGMRLSVSAKR